MAGTPRPSNAWRRRLGWLILIWAGSVAALAVVAGCIRLLMHAAGLAGG